MVKNFAEEIIGRPVSKNWPALFVKRHAKDLKSVYLRCIDNLRVKGEYPPLYKCFFDLVSICFLVVLKITRLKEGLLTYII